MSRSELIRIMGESGLEREHERGLGWGAGGGSSPSRKTGYLAWYKPI